MNCRVMPALVLAWLLVSPAAGEAQRGGRQGGPPLVARAAAPIDLTGTWVSVVTEDWRYRMVTPARSDYRGIPLNAAAEAVADAWDPEADTAAGLACRSYGAGMIMRVPGRLRVAWVDDDTLRVETDAGMQMRLFEFGAPPAELAEPSWQGYSEAAWRFAGGRGTPRVGSLDVITTNLRLGYLRKNGVPYSEGATVTEHFSIVQVAGADVLVVATMVDDPMFLTEPYIVSTQFRREADDAGWDPTPCSATW